MTVSTTLQISVGSSTVLKRTSLSLRRLVLRQAAKKYQFSPVHLFVYHNKGISMSRAIENLKSAQQRAMEGRPKIGGFIYLAETLRKAGVTRNIWSLPACQSLYLTEQGSVVTQGIPLVTGMEDVPSFDQGALVTALRTDQAGEGTFPDFLMAAWKAGVVSYDVDFISRIVTYYGSGGESYVESYSAAEL